MPPGYGYRNWMGEPLALKWQILGAVPLIQFIPIVFALCVAGALQVILMQLQVNFRQGLLIFILQWAGNLAVIWVMTFALNNIVGVLGLVPQPGQESAAGPPGYAQAPPGQSPKKQPPPQEQPAPPSSIQ